MNDSTIPPDQPQPDGRMVLTYPPPGATRFWICLLIAVLTFAFMRFAPGDWVGRRAGYSGSEGTMPAPWFLLLSFAILGFSLFLAISEGLFLLGRKLNPLCLEFDANTLFVTDKSVERRVPFSEIVYIRLVYGKRIFDAARRPYARYAIGFGDPNSPEEIRFAVFYRTIRNFQAFLQAVQEKNPAIEVTNWATNFDGLIRWFKKRS